MTFDQVDRTVVTQEPVIGASPEVGAEPGIGASQQTVRTQSRHIIRPGPGGSELTRRVIVLVFGLVQILIGARFVLLLINARESNDLVAGILDVSQLFVAPFEGMLRADSLHASGSVLDIAAIVAFVGWTLIELIVIWALRIFRREPA